MTRFLVVRMAIALGCMLAFSEPAEARFLSIDPVGYADTGDPAYFNRYSYTANNPVNATDPTGEWTLQIGVDGSAGRGAGGSHEEGIVIGTDKNGNLRVGTYRTSAAGAVAGQSAGIKAQIGATTNVEDLSGFGVQGEGQALAGVGAEMINSGTPGEPHVLLTAGVGIGSSAEVSPTNTTVELVDFVSPELVDTLEAAATHSYHPMDNVAINEMNEAENQTLKEQEQD